MVVVNTHKLVITPASKHITLRLFITYILLLHLLPDLSRSNLAMMKFSAAVSFHADDETSTSPASVLYSRSTTHRDALCAL